MCKSLVKIVCLLLLSSCTIKPGGQLQCFRVCQCFTRYEERGLCQFDGTNVTITEGSDADFCLFIFIVCPFG